MKDTNEKILDAWVQLIMAVNSERLVTDMPFNEAVICNLLYRNKDLKMTATDLCEITGMQKSQMNRTLTAMESKDIIIRQRSNSDKRVIYINLNLNKIDDYQNMHHNILSIVDKLANNLDEDQIKEVIDVFTLVSEIARKEIK